MLPRCLNARNNSNALCCTKQQKAVTFASAAAPSAGRRSRRAKDALGGPDEDALVQQLVESTGLPSAAASRLVAARPAVPGLPSDPLTLQQRVQQLQALLGPERAATAVQRFPQLVCCQPDVLASNLSGWLDFFAPEDSSSSSSSEQDAGGREQLLRKLASRPQLLAVNVETLVGNLYELGAICQAEDLHAFALKNMQLGLTQPSVLQGKMIAVLQLLNSEPQPQQQPHLEQQQAQPPPRRPPPQAFTVRQLQQAARRDTRWLMMSNERLTERLTGLQQRLGVPLATVGRMFLLQPSLVTKSTELLAGRAAALQQLPGLGRERALAAVVAFPALLNLRQERLQQRWEQLQQAAATSPRWQRQLSTVGPASIAAMLIRSQQHYERLRVVTALGRQGSCGLQTLMGMPEHRYQQKLQAWGAAGLTSTG